MDTTIGKWGASCAVRIPKAIVNMLGLHDGTPVDFEIKNNALLIKPVKSKYIFEELVAQMDGCEIPESFDDELSDNEWPAL